MLWDTVLQEDYGVAVDDDDNIAVESSASSSYNYPRRKKRRRKCERLARTALQRVRDAHQLMSTNTEIAFFYVSELVHARIARERLTRARMNKILDEYGPRLRLHRTLSNGGLFLVELCRAKAVTERTVRQCVQSLLEERCGGVAASSINLPSSESPQCRETALCVAAARGMPTVTEYLLQRGADPAVRSSGRFTLHTNKKQSVRCENATAVEFVRAMMRAEQAAGATPASLQGLTKCLRLVEDALAAAATSQSVQQNKLKKRSKK